MHGVSNYDPTCSASCARALWLIKWTNTFVAELSSLCLWCWEPAVRNVVRGLGNPVLIGWCRWTALALCGRGAGRARGEHDAGGVVCLGGGARGGEPRPRGSDWVIKVCKHISSWKNDEACTLISFFQWLWIDIWTFFFSLTRMRHKIGFIVELVWDMIAVLSG